MEVPIMARQGRRPQRQSKINSNRKNTAKERDLVAIVSKSKLVGIWTGDEATSKEIPAPNDRDTRLGAMQLFKEVLEQIPTNEEEILDIKTGIYLLDIVYHTMMNPGDSYADKTISEECRDMILPLRRMWDERCLNCFLVSEKGSSATIVSDGFDWLKEIAERKVAEAYGVTYEKQQIGVNSATTVSFDDSQLRKYQTKLAELEDKLIDADTEEEETSLSKKIAKVQEAINRQYDMMKRAGISFNTTQADEAQA